MLHNYDRRRMLAAVTPKALEKALAEAFLELKLPYAPTEFRSPQEAAKAFGEDIGDQVGRLLERLLDKWGDRIQDVVGLKGKPVFTSKGSEHIWDEYNDEDLHVYYECTFASPVVHKIKVRIQWPSIIKDIETGDFAGVDFNHLFAHPPVAAALSAVLGKVAKEARFSDPQFGKLAGLAIEHSYENSETDFKASDDKDDDMYVNPIHVKIAITTQRATMVAEVVDQSMVLFTTTFDLKGEVLWPGNRHYDEYM